MNSPEAQATTRSGAIAVISGAVVTAVVAWAVASGAELRAEWVPAWNVTIHLRADALGGLFALLAAGIGTLVLVYSAGYLPRHLEEQDRPTAEQHRFFALLLFFLASMVGLALAQDLLLLFVFFELTGIASYFLIGYDVGKGEARRGALMALIVTSTAALGLLVGALLLHARAGTFDLAQLAAAAPAADGAWREWALALIVLAALAKSAQAPLHFWLPRAMAAPTPVSAYLHSAAMVAAGVFVLLRIEPLLADSAVRAALPWLGLASVFLGSALALGSDALKQLLAYSTVAQYGYVVLLIGLGGDAGIAGAAVYVLAHAIAKCGLFLTAGAVTRATGRDKLSELGGLLREQPALAAASLPLAAALAGLPFTIGYFKDEVLFKAALEHGGAFPYLVTAGTALTLAYTARFWVGTFIGGERPVSTGAGRVSGGGAVEEPEPGGAEHAAEEEEPRPAPVGWLLRAPVIVLGLVALAGGVAPHVLARVAEAAGSASARAAASLTLEYAWKPETWLALAMLGAGALLYATRHGWLAAAAAIHRAGVLAGPERAYELVLAYANRASDHMHELEVRDLRDRVAAILFPAGALVLLALAFAFPDRWRAGAIGWHDAPLLVLLVTMAVLSVAAVRQHSHLALVVVLSGVGYTLAAIYALLGAPDLALVGVLVETTLTVVFLLAFGKVPQRSLEREERVEEQPVLQRRHRIAGLAAGASAFAVAWAALSSGGRGSVAAAHERLAPLVHAHDPVAAILSDFRGLDTAGEVTVIAVALTGISILLGTRRSA